MNEAKRQLTDEEKAKVKADVDRRMAAILDKPLVLAVVGPTGLGKTTLVNAVTGANLPTHDVNPCTTAVSERIDLKASSGQKIAFLDSPGFHEGHAADARYLAGYADLFRTSDMVIFGVHADNRGVAPDVAALGRILGELDPPARKAAQNKIAFAQFKCELVGHQPWVYAKDGDGGFFAPQRKTEELLAAKSRYFADAFLKPFAADLESWTYLERPWAPGDPRLTTTEDSVTFRGYLDDATAAELKRRHPDRAAVIDRLADNHKVIPISSRFRFNLYQLLTVVVSKSGPEAVERFRAALKPNDLNRVPFAAARTFSNIVVLDQRQQKVVFDLTKATI